MLFGGVRREPAGPSYLGASEKRLTSTSVLISRSKYRRDPSSLVRQDDDPGRDQPTTPGPSSLYLYQGLGLPSGDFVYVNSVIGLTSTVVARHGPQKLSRTAFCLSGRFRQGLGPVWEPVCGAGYAPKTDWGFAPRETGQGGEYKVDILHTKGF